MLSDAIKELFFTRDIMNSSAVMKILFPVLLVALFAATSLQVANAEAYVNATLLPKSIIVTTTINGVALKPNASSVLKYNADTLTVTWKLNESYAGNDTKYKSVFIKLCFGSMSATDRPWRKNNDNLMKSKTCKYAIKRQDYTAAGSSVTYKLVDTIPSAFYFVRVFVMNTTVAEASLPGHNAVALGSSTDKNRMTNLFTVEAYTGRSTGITIGIICFSIASYALLIGFFLVERMMKKNK